MCQDSQGTHGTKFLLHPHEPHSRANRRSCVLARTLTAHSIIIHLPPTEARGRTSAPRKIFFLLAALCPKSKPCPVESHCPSCASLWVSRNFAQGKAPLPAWQQPMQPLCPAVNGVQSVNGVACRAASASMRPDDGACPTRGVEGSGVLRGEVEEGG